MDIAAKLGGRFTSFSIDQAFHGLKKDPNPPMGMEGSS
jgi:hypothetical protein